MKSPASNISQPNQCGLKIDQHEPRLCAVNVTEPARRHDRRNVSPYLVNRIIRRWKVGVLRVADETFDCIDEHCAHFARQFERRGQF